MLNYDLANLPRLDAVGHTHHAYRIIVHFSESANYESTHFGAIDYTDDKARTGRVGLIISGV